MIRKNSKVTMKDGSLWAVTYIRGNDVKMIRIDRVNHPIILFDKQKLLKDSAEVLY